jgi:antitoxin component YwqK of YwqJK toxin-antitoxin module
MFNLNKNIFYNIGWHINDYKTFYNFIITIKNITNKKLLIDSKKIMFTVKKIGHNKDKKHKEYYLLPNNKKDGNYKLWYDNGNLFKEKNYVNGEIKGEYKQYHYNGVLWKRFYINNKEVFVQDSSSPSIIDNFHLYLSGNHIIDRNINKYIKNGMYEEWYDNGNKCIEVNYINNKSEGLYQEWYDNGFIKVKSNYINGKIDGIYRKWNINGTLSEIYNYVDCNIVSGKSWYNNGILSYDHSISLYREWYDDGKLQCTCDCINYKKCGLYEEWYNNGSIRIRANYVDNNKDGPYKSYHNDNVLWQECNYENNNREGYYISYYSNGNIRRKCKYNKGKIIENIGQWDKNSKKLNIEEYENSKGNEIPKILDSGDFEYRFPQYKDERENRTYEELEEDEDDKG